MNRANRPRMSRVSGSSYASKLMGRAGVLSTLSLDFTAMGGTLDSRITFGRTSNATLINSSGYVQYADANMLVNSPMQDAATTPSGWSFFGVTGGAISIPTTGSRKIEATAAGQQPFAHQSPTVSQGLTYTMSFVVTEIVGTVAYQNVCSVAGAASSQIWVNGVQILNPVIQATVGNYCLIYVAGSGGQMHRIGTGASSGSSGACSMTFNSARLQIGSFTTATYVASSLTSAYYAPRFDYDSTTLVAKGLLLEAAATNLLNWSETFATTGGTNNNWADTNLTRTSTNNTSPRNDATALRITASVLGNGTIISSAAIGTSASRVLSVWLRRVTGTGNIQYTLDNGTSYTTQAITSSWVRYSFPATTAAQRVGFRIVTGLDAIEIWGAQLETEASTSYIPTGVSQVARAVDTAIIAAGSNFSSWYTGGTTGTFVANWYGSASTPTARSVVATNDQTTKHLHMYQTASALTLRLADFPVTTVTTANSLTAGALTKGAFSYAASATSLCLNGGTVATGTLAFSAAPTWLSIGGPSNNGTSITDTTVMLNNSIRTLQYYPARLTDGQIQGLTA